MSARSVASAHRLCTFDLGGRRLCLDVSCVQEILRPRAVAPVPLTPAAIAGLINLRGQIVTVVDPRRLLDPGAAAVDAGASTILVVRTANGAFGLLVDGVDDVLEPDPGAAETVPANLPGTVRELAVRVWNLGASTLVELDAERITRPSTLDRSSSVEPGTTGARP